VLALALGCAGPPFPAPIDGEGLCPDYEAGHTRMEGGLRHPVRLRLLDGKTQIFKMMLTGRKRVGEAVARTFIADANEEYTVEWAQCSNERAPRSVVAATQEKKGHEPNKEAFGYECGEATVYKTEKLATKKGDKESHNLAFAPPPDASCWVAEAPPAAAERDAGAPDAAAAAADAGAMDGGEPAGDAGTASDAGATADAGAASDAGAAEPAKKPAR
jgi:hypothetical protein